MPVEKVRAGSVLMRLWQAVLLTGKKRSYYEMLFLWLVCTTTSVIAGIISAKYLGIMTQGAYNGQMHIVLSALGVTALAAAANMLLVSLTTYINGKFSEDAVRAFRIYSCERLASALYFWIETQKTGDLLERVNSNVDQAGAYICTHIPELISITIRGVFTIIFIITMEWRLSLVYLLLVPLVIWLQSRFSKPIERKYSAMMKANGLRTTLAQDALSNLSTVRAYGLESEMDRRYQFCFLEYLKIFCKAVKLQTQFIIPGMTISILPSSLLYILSAVFIFNGWFSIGGLITLVALCSPLDELLWKLSDRLVGLRRTAAGAKRIFEIWDAPQEKGMIGLALELENDQTLIFDNVSFEYGNDHVVLRDLSFAVKQGEKVALVGRSGCGKSTVLKLVAGLYKPVNGKIMLWGRDAAYIAPSSLRQYISYITQDTFLFPESIRQNILLGSMKANKSNLIEEYESSIMDFVKEWPQGLDTLVGERGMQLSGGQRQRVAIVRAMLCDTPLVLLDEATSALDNMSEKQVQDALDRLLVGRSALIVAHRLSSIRNADRILVMDNGCIVEEGTHEFLMKQGGLYETLYQSQTKEELV